MIRREMYFGSGKTVVLLHFFSLTYNCQTEMRSTHFQAGSRCCVFKADCSALSSHATIVHFCVTLKSSPKVSGSSNEGNRFHNRSQLELPVCVIPCVSDFLSSCFEFQYRSSVAVSELLLVSFSSSALQIEFFFWMCFIFVAHTLFAQDIFTSTDLRQKSGSLLQLEQQIPALFLKYLYLTVMKWIQRSII